MTTDFSHLLTPVSFEKFDSKNRIVSPPIGTSFGSKDGYVTKRILDHYQILAKGGAGIVIVEVACVDWPEGQLIAGQLRIDTKSCLPGLTELAKVIKTSGAKPVIQLHHAGALAKTTLSGTRAVGPSAAIEGEYHPEELTESEIKKIVFKFAEASALAKKAGFEGVMIHGAHYYLVAEFINPRMNKRRDSYGGSLNNRMRFYLEILKAVRDAVGDEYPIWCRIDGEMLSSDGITNEAIDVASILEKGGADILDVSVCANLMEVPPKSKPEGDLMRFAKEIRKKISIPLSAGGGMNFEEAALFASEKIADMVTIGRPLLADPELPNKLELRTAVNIKECTDCRICIDALTKEEPLMCIQNRQLGYL